MNLIEAVKARDLELVKSFIDAGADINQADENGQTLLVYSATAGHIEIVELLLDRGANIDHIGAARNTALTWSALQGHTEVVKLLLNRGADINHVGTEETALMWACCAGHVEVVKLLLRRGASINQTKEKGWTALIHAIVQGEVEIVKLLLDEGADVDQADTNGWTALIWAAKSGRTEIVKFLLERSSNIDQVDAKSSEALKLAAFYGNTEVVKQFLIVGAFTTNDVPQIKKHIDKILDASNLTEKVTVLANFVAVANFQDEELTENIRILMCEKVKEIKSAINAETFNKWEQLRLCQEIQELRAKTKVADITEGILSDLWSDVDRLEPKFERICKNSLDALDMSVDVKKELEAYLTNADKEKIICGIPEQKLLFALRRGDMQELQIQVSKIEKLIITSYCEIKLPAEHYMFEDLLNKSKEIMHIFETGGDNFEEEARIFINIAKEYIVHENAKIAATASMPYETLGLICEALGANSKLGEGELKTDYLFCWPF